MLPAASASVLSAAVKALHSGIITSDRMGFSLVAACCSACCNLLQCVAVYHSEKERKKGHKDQEQKNASVEGGY